MKSLVTRSSYAGRSCREPSLSGLAEAAGRARWDPRRGRGQIRSRSSEAREPVNQVETVTHVQPDDLVVPWNWLDRRDPRLHVVRY